MGLMGKLTNMAKSAIADQMEPRSNSTAPNSEEYAKKVSAKIKADVRMLSGCKDCQTSADVQDVSKFGLPNACGAGGACTNAMLLTLADDAPDSWLSLLKGMQDTLKTKRFSQVPQLSTSRQIDVNDPFAIRNPEGTGKSKALLIGINYIGQQGQLAGCHNDVAMMKEYISNQGYDDFMVLLDDDDHATPDRSGIIEGIRWLVQDAVEGDSLFMHYSGHGGSVRDESGDEADGMDETMVPVDYQESGQITDDEILKELVIVLPAGVTLTVVMDCCHSGSILDLPFSLKADQAKIAAVEAGDESSELQINPEFSYAKMAKTLFSVFRDGEVTTAEMKELAKLAMSYKSSS